MTQSRRGLNMFYSGFEEALKTNETLGIWEIVIPVSEPSQVDLAKILGVRQSHILKAVLKQLCKHSVPMYIQMYISSSSFSAFCLALHFKTFCCQVVTSGAWLSFRLHLRK